MLYTTDNIIEKLKTHVESLNDHQDFKEICTTLLNNNYKITIAGGFLRDAFTNKDIPDIDIFVHSGNSCVVSQYLVDTCVETTCPVYKDFISDIISTFQSITFGKQPKVNIIHIVSKTSEQVTKAFSSSFSKVSVDVSLDFLTGNLIFNNYIVKKSFIKTLNTKVIKLNADTSTSYCNKLDSYFTPLGYTFKVKANKDTYGYLE